jgi:hypothetical protein
MDQLPISDQKIDGLISELLERISQLGTKRFQLLHQRRDPVERSALEALIGNESPEAADLLRTLSELDRVPGLRALVTQGNVSVYRAHQLAKATSNISTVAIQADETVLSEWMTTASWREPVGLLRRWRRAQVTRGPAAAR